MPLNGQPAVQQNVSQFIGNLNSQLYSGKDAAANAASDAFSTGSALLYSGLAAAAKEVGKLPGPIGWTGNVVNVVVGVATSGTQSSPGCSIVGTVVGVAGGIAGGAIGAGGGPVGAFVGATAVGYIAQKGSTALCQTMLGFIDGEKPAASMTSQTIAAEGLGSVLATTTVPTLPASAPAASSAAATIVSTFRPSPDYTGTAGAYTVQSGQTLTSIAKANGLSVAELIAANPQISDPNSIRTGQAIQLPTNASGYVPGTISTDSVPDAAAQTNALTSALEQSAGKDVSIVAENSGRIAVLSSTTGLVTLIANDGTASIESLATYNQQAKATYDGYVANGFIDPSVASVIYSDYQNNIYGALDAQGNGTIVTNAGMLYQDANGNIAALSDAGVAYTYDKSTGRNVFAQNVGIGASATLVADIQTKNLDTSITDNINGYASNGARQFGQLENTSAAGTTITTTTISGDTNGVYTQVDRSFDAQGNLTSTATTSRATPGGELTTTVDSKVGGNDVSVTYSYDANKTPIVQSLNSIHGQAVDVATPDAFALQANNASGQNPSGSSQDPVALTQALAPAILPTLNINVNNVDTAVSTNTDTNGTVETVTLVNGRNVNLTGGNQYGGTTTAPPADSATGSEIPVVLTTPPTTVSPSTITINGVIVTDNGDAVVTTPKQDGHTTRYKNRSCLRKYLFGCRHKTYLKTGKTAPKQLLSEIKSEQQLNN